MRFRRARFAVTGNQYAFNVDVTLKGPVPRALMYRLLLLQRSFYNVGFSMGL